MSLISWATSLKSDKLDKLSGELHLRASQVVRKTAFDIQAGAEDRARVDTGAMKNGFYVVTSSEDHYPEAAAEVKAANPEAGVADPIPAPADDLTAIVGAAAAHTVYNEYGTVRMSAQPMLTPAAEDARPAFEAAMKHIADLT